MPARKDNRANTDWDEEDIAFYESSRKAKSHFLISILCIIIGAIAMSVQAIASEKKIEESLMKINSITQTVHENLQHIQQLLNVIEMQREAQNRFAEEQKARYSELQARLEKLSMLSMPLNQKLFRSEFW